MAVLNIKDPAAHLLASDLAKRTGETITDAVIHALLERLSRFPAERPADRKARLLALSNRAASIPNQDPRSADEILGYDEHGLPTGNGSPDGH
ncbi:MAG: type II toxin-antitoxin system VapB family antitoxin [Bryobacteraceae bacterium]